MNNDYEEERKTPRERQEPTIERITHDATPPRLGSRTDALFNS